jgi:DNA-binding CsgD family transcriptional regulator
VAAHGSGPETDLSPLEFEILRGVAKGLAIKEIADSLRISPHAVTTHLERIFEKVGTHDRDYWPDPPESA